MTTHGPVTGVAAGVPFLAVPPSDDSSSSAPVVVAWHMADPPRTEAAFAAAVPLDGLDAWRIYLGLPLSGSRRPEGGVDEIMRLGYEDAVMNLQGPTAFGAAQEFPAALAELRAQLGLADGPIGVVGGSIGAAVAQLVIAEQDIAIDAAVLVSPLVQLRPLVDVSAAVFGITYTWQEASDAVAARMDFIARVDELAGGGQPPVLLVVGEDDHPTAIVEPAARLREALADRYENPGNVQLVTVPGMAHALAEEPGIDPAPQTAHAAEVDRHAVRWLAGHLAF